MHSHEFLLLPSTSKTSDLSIIPKCTCKPQFKAFSQRLLISCSFCRCCLFPTYLTLHPVFRNMYYFAFSEKSLRVLFFAEYSSLIASNSSSPISLHRLEPNFDPGFHNVLSTRVYLFLPFCIFIIFLFLDCKLKLTDILCFAL